jgi:hypothetical protein
MTADVLVMPGYRMAVVPLLSGETRLERLRLLARDADCMADELVADALAVYASERMSAAERDIAWNGYLAALTLAEKVRLGLIGWEAVNDELTCSDRQEVAADIAAQNAEDALGLLAGVTTTGVAAS